MPRVTDLFTYRRDKAASAGQPEVYVYNKMPEQLIGQIVHIWNDDLEDGRLYEFPDRRIAGRDLWNYVQQIFFREYGLLSWPWRASDFSNPAGTDDNVIRFFREHATNDQRLNLIELTFRLIAGRKGGETSVDELNERFKRAGVGY